MNSTDPTFYCYAVSDLTDDDRSSLLESGFSLVCQVFQGVDRQETADHMFGNPDANQDLIVAYNSAHQLIAFAGVRQLSIGGILLTYRVGTIVDPSYQSQGLYKQLLRESIHGDSKAMIATTQNPRVYRAIQSAGLFSQVYPDLNGQGVPTQIADLAAQTLVATNADSLIDPGTLIVRNRYAGSLYAKPIHCRSEDVNTLFRRLGKGDGYVIIGLR